MSEHAELSPPIFQPARVGTWRGFVARISVLGRVGFVASALLFSLVTRHVYADVLGRATVLQYMGVRVLPTTTAVSLLFLALAVFPSVWLPTRLRRPSDVVQLFLYYAVHIPTAVLLPLVSRSSTAEQAVFAGAIGVALLALDARYYLPRLQLPTMRLNARVFWFGVALFYAAAIASFAASGYLSFSKLNLFDVYGQRLELAARAGQIGKVFFYMANWSGAALGPFLLVAGLHKKRFLLVAAGIGIATLSFIASSNRANYAAVIAVVAGYYAIRTSKGRHFGTIMAVSFVVLAEVLLLADGRLTPHEGGVLRTPLITYGVFHRVFTNNGFLSAIYLDLARDHGFAWYADSFLRWLPGPRLDAPVPVLAGASFTQVQDVWANANLWADAYANLGYIGVALTFAMTTCVLWLYDGIAAKKDPVVAASLLVVPTAMLANAAIYLSLFSNGMLIVFLLLYAWSGADRAQDAS
jgi:hypothetical protein